jgi:hypothetical protein
MRQGDDEHEKFDDPQLLFHSALLGVFDNVAEVNLKLLILEKHS